MNGRKSYLVIGGEHFSCFLQLQSTVKFASSMHSKREIEREDWQEKTLKCKKKEFIKHFNMLT